ncbi:MAG: bromoperoxidase [Pseudomonadota bacterium]
MKNNDRRIEAKRFREDAAQVAFNRDHPTHLANGDEQKFASAKYLMSFTKGLDHDPVTGLIVNKNHFETFRQAIDNGVTEPFTTRVPVPMSQIRRQWEAPTAGVVFDLEGPDAQAVTMPPAPSMGSDELTFEMAEVYELALVRDVPFEQFDAHGRSPGLRDSIDRLNAMKYITRAKECCEFAGRPRKVGADGLLNQQTVFRGFSPGSDEGPWLSAFMLMGNGDRTGDLGPLNGKITYGAQTIDQRVPAAPEGDDYMVDWGDYLAVQQGYDVNRTNGTQGGQAFNVGGTPQPYRFIHTPRDLATYVHFDALYQAYLNACLILLTNGGPPLTPTGPSLGGAFDPAFDNLSGASGFSVLTNAATGDMKPTNAGGFALYGGPHILTLVTEVATRALKAVRFQKFNNHTRLRPEALAARMVVAEEIDKAYPLHSGPNDCELFTTMRDHLNRPLKKGKPETSTLGAIAAKNPPLGNTHLPNAENFLLPMAFAEGSPMHPAYGAGHATVAGACVTVLKAFFDTSAMLARLGGRIGFFTQEQIAASGQQPEWIKIVTINGGEKLDAVPISCPLTLEGELNKLSANISIGRNMAGVHYFTDYFDSVRMGEEIAIGMLEEQAIGYPTDPFVMSVPTFDGEVERIGAR